MITSRTEGPRGVGGGWGQEKEGWGGPACLWRRGGAVSGLPMPMRGGGKSKRCCTDVAIVWPPSIFLETTAGRSKLPQATRGRGVALAKFLGNHFTTIRYFHLVYRSLPSSSFSTLKFQNTLRRRIATTNATMLTSRRKLISFYSKTKQTTNCWGRQLFTFYLYPSLSLSASPFLKLRNKMKNKVYVQTINKLDRKVWHWYTSPAVLPLVINFIIVQSFWSIFTLSCISKCLWYVETLYLNHHNRLVRFILLIHVLYCYLFYRVALMSNLILYMAVNFG